MTSNSRLILTAIFLFLSATVRAQGIIGTQYNDAILTLGLDYTQSHDGAVTKLIYAIKTVDHPGIGTFKEYNQYDFLNGICEARHIFMPKAYEQAYIEYFNKKYGWAGNNLWQEENHYHVTIKDHDNNFELMVWSPTYENMLNSRY